MTDKITDFLKTVKESDDQVLPIERDSIIKHLNSVPSDIMIEYVGVLTNYIEDRVILRSIVSSFGSPHLCRYLIENLNQEQFLRLNDIAVSLSSINPLDKIDDLKKNTFGIVTPTDGSISRAKNLIRQIIDSEIDYKVESEKLVTFAKDVRFIADILMVLNMGKDFENFLNWRLCAMSENELDRFNEIFNQIVVNNP